MNNAKKKTDGNTNKEYLNPRSSNIDKLTLHTPTPIIIFLLKP